MIVPIVVAALLVIGLAVALGSGAWSRLSVRRTASVDTAGGHPLPEGTVGSSDVERVRFDIALRGYRMDQVDEVLRRLRERLSELETEVANGRPGGGRIAVLPLPGTARAGEQPTSSSGATTDIPEAPRRDR